MPNNLLNAIRQLISALLIALVVAFANYAQESSSRSSWVWNQSDDGRKIEVRVENKVEFNEDYSDVASIPSDGALKIYDSRGEPKFRLVITRGPGGELRREYSVNGQSHAFDAEGQAWLRKVLLQAVREGGLDARNRVQRILKQRGTRGLIEEMAYIKGDYVRRIYFGELLRVPNLSNGELKTSLRNASTTISSDYERAQLLLQVGPVFLPNKELVPVYFEALSKFQSGYEHHRVLEGALKIETLGNEALTAMVQSAAKIESDYEKASFLLKAANRYQSDDRLRAEWLSALRTVGSDYEHRRVLSGTLKSSELSAEALINLVESAASLESDYEKATFLIEALSRYQPNARLRAAFVNTAKTIGSEYERGRVQKRMDRDF
jgi:hypothetical protein